MDNSENEMTNRHLWNIAQHLTKLCPTASRYYMFTLKRHLLGISSNKPKELKGRKLCDHCGSLWTTENHSVRIQSVASKTKHMKKLLKWEASEPWKLNNQQKRKLKRFKEETSKIVYTCFSCKKVTKFPGVKRKILNSNKRNSLYTLPISAKRKKTDLNAGLFIATTPATETKNINKDLSENIYQDSSKIINKVPMKDKIGIKQTSKDPINLSSLPKSANRKKKKKSLWEKILNQEQETEKTKTNLSSFLVSI